jgi:imidazoleglycerol phosphate dehydratase HisB
MRRSRRQKGAFAMTARTAEISRKTNETAISVTVNLDGGQA